MRRRLLIVVNQPAFFLSHRLPVALAARRAGWDVHVATGPGEGAPAIASAGLTHHALPLDRGGFSPLRDLRFFLSLALLVHRLRPDVLHSVTIKPVLWGGFAGRLLRVPGRVAAISGLGWALTSADIRARLLRPLILALYRLALGGPGIRAVFQNDADRSDIEALVTPLGASARMIRGSGVDLARFRPAPEPDGRVQVLFAGRLLADKGLAEFLAAAERLTAEGVEADFLIAGDRDPANPAVIPEAQVERWAAMGTVRFLGRVEDMTRLLSRVHLVVLPSYAEGLPKVLLEAAASGRAVVTTTVPGCRAAVVPDQTALVVPPRAAAPLAGAIRALVEDGERRRAMGAAGRVLAEERFDVRDVAAAHLALYEELLSRRQTTPEPVSDAAVLTVSQNG